MAGQRAPTRLRPSGNHQKSFWE